MTTLNRTIESLASNFAAEIIRAIRGASLQEILGAGTAPSPKIKIAHRVARKGEAPQRRGKGGRLARRTQEQIGEQLAKVVALLKKNPDGMRSEEIRDALKLDRREMPRILAEGVASKAFKKKGAKRATVYFMR